MQQNDKESRIQKNYEITLLYRFHAQKALFKVPKICNIIFWIEIDPPPLREAIIYKRNMKEFHEGGGGVIWFTLLTWFVHC